MSEALAGDSGGEHGSRRLAKSREAFRTISEVAVDLNVPQHVLRFWETKFAQVRPLKRGGGRRYYRPEDVELLRRIRSLLYSEGYTIKGVQKLLRETAGRSPSGAGGTDEQPPPVAAGPVRPEGANGTLSGAQRRLLEQALAELESVKAELADLEK